MGRSRASLAIASSVFAFYACDSSSSQSASSICAAALGKKVVTSQSTTLGAVRQANFGGPAPGIVPGRNAFPGRPDNEPAAWCWTRAPDVINGSPGPNWTLYVAVRGGHAKGLFTMGAPKPPTGPPSIK